MREHLAALQLEQAERKRWYQSQVLGEGGQPESQSLPNRLVRRQSAAQRRRRGARAACCRLQRRHRTFKIQQSALQILTNLRGEEGELTIQRRRLTTAPGKLSVTDEINTTKWSKRKSNSFKRERTCNV